MQSVRQMSPISEATSLFQTVFSPTNAVNVTALKQGDQDAFRDIVAAYQDKVFNTCLGFLDSRQEAEDTSQEVFIEVFRSIKEFRGDASLSTWIYRITVTKALQEIRKKRRLKRFALFIPRGDEKDDPLDRVSDPEERNHPLSQLVDKEQAEILHAALSALPESQRVAFTLHKVEGLSHQEIASIMDSTTSGVESLIHRARVNLRKRLFAYYRKELS
jgi:RNA polymerase sigma factor (sigma-70 family)